MVGREPVVAIESFANPSTTIDKPLMIISNPYNLPRRQRKKNGARSYNRDCWNCQHACMVVFLAQHCFFLVFFFPQPIGVAETGWKLERFLHDSLAFSFRARSKNIAATSPLRRIWVVGMGPGQAAQLLLLLLNPACCLSG